MFVSFKEDYIGLHAESTRIRMAITEDDVNNKTDSNRKSRVVDLVKDELLKMTMQYNVQYVVVLFTGTVNVILQVIVETK